MNPTITIHDEHGFTQELRRALLLLVCDIEQEKAQEAGHALTWTEQLDGVTVYVDGKFNSRITYAQLAHLEEHPEDCPRA